MLIPFVLNLENPYAAMAQITVLTTIVTPTIRTVFPIFSKKSYVLYQEFVAFQCRVIRNIVDWHLEQFTWRCDR